MNKKVPLRQCIGCGQMKGKKELMRGKKNGRGAYLCRSSDCLKKARKSKGLERSFKMSIPNEVYDQLEKEFEEFEAE